MRISFAWLSEWVDPGMDAEALASRLTMSGIEVEAVEPAAGDLMYLSNTVHVLLKIITLQHLLALLCAYAKQSKRQTR